MIKPEFPFKGNQLILSSDRIMLHTKSDAIFLFGAGAVALSSLQTINLDAKEKVLIDSPKIELGSKAIDEGEPITKALELTIILLQLLQKLESAGTLLAQSAAGNNATPELGASMQAIALAGKTLGTEASRLINVLGITPETNPIMSSVTYTR
jgi:hypothetical protein